MKTILVTGSTDGIGMATARALYIRGHHVIVHGRDEERAKESAQLIQSTPPSLENFRVDDQLIDSSQFGQLTSVWGDLSVMDQVVELAKQVNALGALDVLINNAGVYMNERVLSVDGFEMTFCVNHLAPFLLTHHLLPNLKSRANARIINVSSIAHGKGRILFDDLNCEKRFDAYAAYASTKMMSVLFTRALAAILKNTNVTANCLHPGVISTKLLKAGFNISGDSVEKGAETSVFLALEPALQDKNGCYFVNCHLTMPSRFASDDKMALQLWRKSEELLKPWLISKNP